MQKHSNNVSDKHSNSASDRHSNKASDRHSNIVSHRHSNKASDRHSNIVSHRHSNKASDIHSNNVSDIRSNNVSDGHWHNVTGRHLTNISDRHPNAFSNNHFDIARGMRSNDTRYSKRSNTDKSKNSLAKMDTHETHYVSGRGFVSKFIVLKYLKDTSHKDIHYVPVNVIRYNSRIPNLYKPYQLPKEKDTQEKIPIRDIIGSDRQTQTKKKVYTSPSFNLSTSPRRQGSYPSPPLPKPPRHNCIKTTTSYPSPRPQINRLGNLADFLKGSGYVLGKKSQSSRRYSENLQKLKSRLKKSHSQGDFGPSVRLFMPRVRFRRAGRLIILLLRAIYTTRERTQRQQKERKISLCLNISNPNSMTSKRAYETYGLSFDPQDFKANRQIQITSEARSILSMDPCQRSTQQLHAVLVSLRQAVSEFSEFPINMQQSLAKVGRYERFTAKRVIIRQGHLADNFYFILSGTAVVIILETDKMIGEQTMRTAAVLGRGKSFGELALMHKARRSATVTCRDDVELLSVGREDFVDIFMHVDRGVEPEHIRFLRGLPMLRGWPLHLLPHDNPKILLFTYVRKGVVLCQDSNSTEWIFIIKSGSCRIIKALPELPSPKAKKSTKPTAKFNSKGTLPISRPLISRSLVRIEEEAATSDEDQESLLSDELQILELGVAKKKNDGISLGKTGDEQNDKKLSLQYIQSLDAITEHKNVNSPNEDTENDLQEELNTKGSTQPCIFVQVLKLGRKDIYGLETSLFSTMKKTVSTSLVSDGAELIMIKRKFFMDNTSSDLRKRMRKEIHPLPNEESLQNQLQSRVEWETYRSHTLQKTMSDMNLIDRR